MSPLAPHYPMRISLNTPVFFLLNRTQAPQIDLDDSRLHLEQMLRLLLAEQEQEQERQRQLQQQHIQQVGEVQHEDTEAPVIATGTLPADTSERRQAQHQDQSHDSDEYEEGTGAVSSTRESEDESEHGLRLPFIREYFGNRRSDDDNESESSSESDSDAEVYSHVDFDEEEESHATFASYFMGIDYAAEERARQEERRQTRLECERLRLLFRWDDDDDDEEQ